MADVADEAPSRRVRHAVLAAIERCCWGYQGGNISFPMGCQGTKSSRCQALFLTKI